MTKKYQKFSRAALRSGPLPLVLTLTVVAGFLDAFSLTGTTGTLIANQTGNTVLIGIGLAGGQLGDSWPPVAAVAAFLVGAMLSSLLVTGADSARRLVRLLVSELVLLGGYLAVLLATVGTRTQQASGGAPFRSSPRLSSPMSVVPP